MNVFYNRIKEICQEKEKVAMFIDMDGTIVEYIVFPDEKISTTAKGMFLDAQPIDIVLNNLRKINNIENIDLYILSLSRSSIIVEEKKHWLKKYANFIKEENWIIINKEKGEYNKENRNFIKSEKIKEKLQEYSCVILLDDDHEILKQTQNDLKDKGYAFHLSSAVM